jgi:cytidylate kinase
MKALVLSGMPAVGKTTVGRMVADSLGLKVVGGGDVLKEMAMEEGYAPGGNDWWDTGDGMRFLQQRKSSPSFDKDVDSRLLRKARSGDIVITSYPLPWLTDSGVKVWLAGSVESRAGRMAKRDHLDEAECRRILAIRDGENHKLYKNLYGIDFGNDLKPFDLIVDTDSIDESRVAEIILRYARSRRD